MEKQLKFSNNTVKTLNKANKIKLSASAKAVKSLSTQKSNLETKIKSQGGDIKKKPSLLEGFFNALDSLSNAIKVPIQRSLRDESQGLGKDIVDGFLYKEEGSYGNILSELGVNNKAVKFVGGLALEIIADPLNYIPVAGVIGASADTSKLIGNINEAKKLTKGKGLGDTVKTLDGLSDIRNIDKKMITHTGANLKRIKPLGIDTGIYGYTLDDMIFGAAFKGVGKGFKAGYKGIEKLSPQIATELSGLGRYAKQLFVNSTNINKASKEFGQIGKTFAEQSYIQKNLHDLGEAVVQDITNYSEELVKAGKYADYETAYNAVNNDILKVFQNRNDMARTLPEIASSLLNNSKYTLARDLDDILKSDDALALLVKRLQESGVKLEKGAGGQGTILRLDSKLLADKDKAQDYINEINLAVKDLVDKGFDERIALPKFSHALDKNLDLARIEKMTDGLGNFLETLQSSIKDRQDLVKFTQVMGNDAWLPKIVTQEFKQHKLAQDLAENSIEKVNIYSKNTIGEPDHKLFSQTYETTPLDTNIILGHNLFDFDISKIMHEANQRFTKNVYADVLKYDVIKGALADGLIKPVEAVKKGDKLMIPAHAPAGFKEIAATELTHAIDSMYNLNKVVYGYDKIEDALRVKQTSQKTLDKLNKLASLTPKQEALMQEAQSAIESANKMLDGTSDKIMAEFNELTGTRSAVAEVSDLSKVKGKIYIDNGYFNMIKRVTGAQDEIKGLLGVYNKMMSAFKTTALFSVGFHARNFFGNTMNMYLRGLPLGESLKLTQEAAVDLYKVGNVNKKLSKMLYDNPKLMDAIRNSKNSMEGMLTLVQKQFPNDYKEFKEWTEALADGVFDSNKYIAEISEGANKGYKSAYSKVAKAKEIAYSPFAANFKLGMFSDNMTRMAVWKWAKKNPDKLAEINGISPRMLSKEIMFDFNDLTSFETGVMRQILPFYTWASKNIAFQFRNMVINSGKYRNVVKVYNQFNQMSEDSGQEMPEYADWTLPIPIGDGDRVEYLSLTPTFVDGYNFIAGLVYPQGAESSFLAGSNPYLKSFLESQSGNNLFTGQPLDNSNFIARLGDNLFGSAKRNILQGQFVNGFIKTKDKESVQISNLYNDLDRLRSQWRKMEAKSRKKE